MNDYYTLIWKDINNNNVVCFKSFTNYHDLRIHVKEYIKGGNMKNTKPIDNEKLVYYCEVKEYENDSND